MEAAFCTRYTHPWFYFHNKKSSEGRSLHILCGIFLCIRLSLLQLRFCFCNVFSCNNQITSHILYELLNGFRISAFLIITKIGCLSKKEGGREGRRGCIKLAQFHPVGVCSLFIYFLKKIMYCLILFGSWSQLLETLPLPNVRTSTLKNLAILVWSMNCFAYVWMIGILITDNYTLIIIIWCRLNGYAQLHRLNL